MTDSRDSESTALPPECEDTAAPAEDRELLIRQVAAILAGWGVTEEEDDILAPVAQAIAGLFTPSTEKD